jgi:hypothetical protein
MPGGLLWIVVGASVLLGQRRGRARPERSTD